AAQPTAVAHFQKLSAAHGRQRQGFQEREQHGHGHRDAELKEKFSHDAFHEDHGHEYRQNRDGSGDGGERDLARPHNGGFHPGEAFLAVAHDVFQHHD